MAMWCATFSPRPRQLAWAIGMNAQPRRENLKMLAAGAGSAAGTREEARGLIAEENAKPGTRAWMLDKTRIDPATKYRCPWIEGYAWRATVKARRHVFPDQVCHGFGLCDVCECYLSSAFAIIPLRGAAMYIDYGPFLLSSQFSFAILASRHSGALAPILAASWLTTLFACGFLVTAASNPHPPSGPS